ncbi:MAG: DUF3737 family protein [Clostridiales bacterium]|nr:DUF3737 family protein [Clostridiales bacterium]
MKYISDQTFSGERPLYGTSDIHLQNVTFGEGESPLKECRNITAERITFGWKYPLWYCSDVKVTDSVWEEMARAGVWYTANCAVSGSKIYAPKNFRRCRDLTIENTEFTNAAETLWSCDDVFLKNVTAAGDYLLMNSRNVKISGLRLDGNYPFDGCENVTVDNSRLISKDSFWNCRNVTVRNTYINGEYLGWNSENLTFENCTIESLQGLCYINGLTMRNCRLVNTTLAFEYSSVDAQIDSDIDSILNPGSGEIRCGRIGELIIEKDRVDPDLTRITATSIDKRSDRPDWIS